MSHAMPWAAFLNKAAEDLKIPTPAFTAFAKQAKTMIPELEGFFKVCTEKALASEDRNLLRYVEGGWLMDARARLFPLDSIKEVASLFNLPVVQLIEIENNERIYPNTRREYATRLLEYEKAQAVAQADSVAAKEMSTTSEKAGADRISNLQNPHAILTTPADERLCGEMRRRVRAVGRKAGWGFFAWLERRIGAKAGFLSAFFNENVAWLPSTKAYILRIAEYLEDKTDEQVISIFKEDPDSAINRRRAYHANKRDRKETARQQRLKSAAKEVVGDLVVHLDKQKATKVAGEIPFTDDLRMQHSFVMAARRVLHTVDTHRLEQLNQQAAQQMQELQKQQDMIDAILKKASASSTEMNFQEAVVILDALEVLGV